MGRVEGEKFRDPNDCSVYYWCVYGDPLRKTCPRGTVFDDVNDVCDWPSNVDCDVTATAPPQPTAGPPTTPPPSPSTARPTSGPTSGPATTQGPTSGSTAGPATTQGPTSGPRTTSGGGDGGTWRDNFFPGPGAGRPWSTCLLIPLNTSPPPPHQLRLSVVRLAVFLFWFSVLPAIQWLLAHYFLCNRCVISRKPTVNPICTCFLVYMCPVFKT